MAGAVRDAFVGSARAPANTTAVDELNGISLPLAPTALLGRDVDVQALGQWLADPAVRLITLTGPGGVGKTRLAVEVARAIGADGANRVVFVPLAWYEQILNLPSIPPASELRALIGAAIMCYVQGEHERARTGATRALELAHAASDREMVAEAEHLLGYVEYALGNMDAARDRFTHSVEGFRTLSIPWGVGYSLSGMAAVALATGDAGHSERLLEEAASVLRDAGPWFLSLGRYMRAVLAVRRGNFDQAIALVRESLTRIRELHDKFAFVYTLVPLAAAAALKGDDAWAARILGARDTVVERTGLTIVDPPVHDLREQAEREARAHLGPEQWALAYAAGRKTSIDALLKDIDDVFAETVCRRVVTGRIESHDTWRSAVLWGPTQALRESAGYTQEELATIAGLSVHAVSALERGERRSAASPPCRRRTAHQLLEGAAERPLRLVADGVGDCRHLGTFKQ